MPKAGGCPSLATRLVTITRFDVDVHTLNKYAVPNDTAIFGHLSDWAIPGDLADRIDTEWANIQAWWNPCLTTIERAKVNATTTWWKNKGGVQSIPEQTQPGHPLDFIGNTAHDLAQALAWITSGETWIRLGEVLAGAILFLVALWLVTGHTQGGRKLEGIATKGAMA